MNKPIHLYTYITYYLLTDIMNYLTFLILILSYDHCIIFTGRIAAGEGRFNTNSEVVINTEVKSIPVTKKGVYFAFRDQGACISLLAIKVH